MPAVNVYKSWESELSGERESRTALRKYTVLVDDPDTGELDAGLAPDIPRIGDSWSTADYWLQASAVKVRTISPYLYEVSVNYSTRDPSEYPASAPPAGGGPGPWGSPGIGGGPGTSYTTVWGYMSSPLEEPPEISWSFATSQEPIDTDIAGRPLTNTADEPFDQPPTRDFDDLVLSISRNEPAVDPLTMLAYQGAVNSDQFGFAAPGQARMTRISAEAHTENGATYWKVRYEIQFRADGWTKRIRNEGYREKTGTDAEGRPIYRQITDPSGTALSKPVPLDVDGKRLPAGQPPVWLYFQVYPSLPFAPLGLV